MKRRLWGYICLGILMLGNIGLGLFLAWFLRNITEAATHHALHRVITLSLVGLGTCVVNGAVVFANHYMTAEVVNRLVQNLKSDLFHHILRLPLPAMDRYCSGDLISRLTTDIDDVGHAAGITLPNLVRMPLTALAAFVYVLHINGQLSLICLAFAPLAALIGMTFSRFVRTNSRRLYQAFGQIQSFMQDSLDGQVIVKSFQLEKSLSDRFQAQNESLFRILMFGATLRSGMASGSSIGGFVLFLISVGLGAVYIARDALSVGALLAFIALIQQSVQPLIGAVGHFGELQRSMQALERVFAVLHETAEEMPIAESVFPRRFGILELRHVTFSYDGVINAVEDVSFTVPAGSVVALVGTSGAGKSTLLRLLSALYEPISGSILVDGQPLSTPSADARRTSAYVPQEAFLFHGTVRENLLCGNPNATDEEMMDAARAANVHDVIMALPMGYNSDIGSRGTKLSGGERQRLAIARALLRNAPLLLLDEATSALDSDTEQQVQIGLRRLMQSRTTFVIAHRLFTVQEADFILVMDKGRVIESGTHRQLLSQAGLYAKMCGQLSFHDKTFFVKNINVHF